MATVADTAMEVSECREKEEKQRERSGPALAPVEILKPTRWESDQAESGAAVCLQAKLQCSRRALTVYKWSAIFRSESASKTCPAERGSFKGKADEDQAVVVLPVVGSHRGGLTRIAKTATPRNGDCEVKLKHNEHLQGPPVTGWRRASRVVKIEVAGSSVAQNPDGAGSACQLANHNADLQRSVMNPTKRRRERSSFQLTSRMGQALDLSTGVSRFVN
jgi:hypothetical protein